MQDLRYIFGSPIDVDIGLLYPIGVLDYTLNINCFNILNVTTNLLLQKIDIKEKELRDKIKIEVKNFDVLIEEESLFPIFKKLLSLCFHIKENKIQKFIYENKIMVTLNYNEDKIKELSELESLIKDENNMEKIDSYNKRIKEIKTNIINKSINRENYDHIRNEIIKINGIKLPKQANNAELQKWFDKSEKAKNINSSNIDMEDIIVGIMSVAGYTPKQMSEMTIYQINKIIEKIKNREEFKMNVQFICAGGKDIKLKSWLEHIDEAKANKNSFKLDTFTKNANALLKG